jgi:hypothetical protein
MDISTLVRGSSSGGNFSTGAVSLLYAPKKGCNYRMGQKLGTVGMSLWCFAFWSKSLAKSGIVVGIPQLPISSSRASVVPSQFL